MRICNSSCFDPVQNLQTERELFATAEDVPILYLWQNHRCVILGRNQLPEEEVNLGLAERMKVPVLHRFTGGGAVFQDDGNLNFSIILPSSLCSDLPVYETVLSPVLLALRKLGIPAEYNGRNDLCVRNRKISGCASRESASRLLVHGTLLIRCDLELMSAILTPEAGKLERHGVASVRQRVANISEFIPKITVEAVKKIIQAEYESWWRNSAAESLSASDKE